MTATFTLEHSPDGSYTATAQCEHGRAEAWPRAANGEPDAASVKALLARNLTRLHGCRCWADAAPLP